MTSEVVIVRQKPFIRGLVVFDVVAVLVLLRSPCRILRRLLGIRIVICGNCSLTGAFEYSAAVDDL